MKVKVNQMYSFVLLILLGMVSVLLTTVAVKVLPPLMKIPFIGEENVLVAVVASLLVWAGNVSFLGTFGFNSTQEWFNIAVTGVAVSAFNTVTHAGVRYLEK